MNPYSFSVFFFGFGFFFVAAFVVLSRLDRVGVLFGVYSFFVTAWALPYGIMVGSGTSEEIALLCGRLCCTFSLFIGPTWLHFCSVVSNRNLSRKLLESVYTMAVLITLFTFTDLYIPRVEPILEFDFYPRPGPLYHLLSALFTFCVFFGFYILWVSAKKSPTLFEKRNLYGLAFASAYGYVGGSLSFLPVYEIEFPQYALWFMPLYPFLLAFFITRTNLLNEVEVVTAAHKDKLATVGTLAASLNHEIKNPLYVIQGLIQSFRQNQAEELYGSERQALDAARQLMEKAEHQIQRTVEIMKNFSAFAKEKISAVPQFQNIDVGKVLSRVLPLLRYELELEKIVIENRIEGGIVNVRADERYLEEILFNLIMNSCQAMKNTGGELVISAVSEKDRVVISIQDNGPGIPKELQKQIFEPFYTTKKEGTGLGLYITKQLVEKLNGRISIASASGEGTTFKLEFEAICE